MFFRYSIYFYLFMTAHKNPSRKIFYGFLQKFKIPQQFSSKRFRLILSKNSSIESSGNFFKENLKPKTFKQDLKDSFLVHKFFHRNLFMDAIGNSCINSFTDSFRNVSKYFPLNVLRKPSRFSSKDTFRKFSSNSCRN